MAHYDLTVTPGTHEIKVVSEFKATPEALFKAYTDPELIKQWWGPREYTTEIKEHEPKVGGRWRFVHVGPDEDGTHGFHGVYHTVDAPHQLVYTFEYEGMPGHVMMETVTLDDNGNDTTKVTTQSVFQSVEDRDGMIASGMEGGMTDSIERLAELLQKS